MADTERRPRKGEEKDKKGRKAGGQWQKIDIEEKK